MELRVVTEPLNMAVERTGQDRTGQDRTGQDRTGQDRTGCPPDLGSLSFIVGHVQWPQAIVDNSCQDALRIQ